MNRGNICFEHIMIRNKTTEGLDDGYVFVYSIQEKLYDCQITDINLLKNKKVVDTVIAGDCCLCEKPIKDYYRISFYDDRTFSVEIKCGNHYEFTIQELGNSFSFIFSMVYFNGKLINIHQHKSEIKKNFNKLTFNEVANKFKEHDILNYSDILAPIEDIVYH